MADTVVFNIQRFSLQDGPGIRTTVFVKGCALRCLWCANPESQKGYPQVAHSDALCTKCGACLDACPQRAISLTEKAIRIDRALCDNCMACVDACVYGAIKTYGQRMTSDEVVKIILRDLRYYRKTGGGVTVSGGEPLTQPEFVREVLQGCKAQGIHTCLDTCGQAPEASLLRVLEYTDLVYYDVKVAGSASHWRAAGHPNDQILSNLHLVASRPVELVIRIPFIPGINSAPEEIESIVRIITALPEGGRREVNLLPYHRLGSVKYHMLEMDYDLADLETVKAGDPDLGRAKELIEASGLKCKIVV